jgi:pilus assembly protein TadC
VKENLEIAKRKLQERLEKAQQGLSFFLLFFPLILALFIVVVFPFNIFTCKYNVEIDFISNISCFLQSC